MSFSSDAKEEICRQKLDRRCCSVAESCGVLLYCHTFSPDVIRISTSNTYFISRLPRLFRKAFGFSFDILPPEDAVGRRSLLITDKAK
ncbi:MAG: DNA-binding protein WhiA, partial [Oscillospiraceae bacterium]|nr:DNA-binding protein WhiA [Oscillospiraceae bacterium]